RRWPTSPSTTPTRLPSWSSWREPTCPRPPLRERKNCEVQIAKCKLSICTSQFALRNSEGGRNPMSADLTTLEQGALAALKDCTDEASLRAWRTRYFGDRGEVNKALKVIGTLPKEQRPAYGQEVNRIKGALLVAGEQAEARMKEQALERSL